MRRLVPILLVTFSVTGLGLRAQETTKKQQARPAGVQAPAAKAKAAVPTPPKDHSEDEKAIAALIAAFTKAFDAGDAKAAAATFAPEAITVDEQGEVTIGRAAIEKQLAESFTENPGDKINITTGLLLFPGPDTALEEGQTTITPGSGGPSELTHYVAVYIKQGAQWLLSALREEYANGLSAHDHLKALEWMVGEWVNESQDAVVHTTCKWSEDGNFLLRDFTMKTQGEPVLEGSQRIGWDPTRRQFKTWIFDSEGGFGEGYWTSNSENWMIKVEGVRQDGQQVSATNIITPLGKDRASWQSVDRTIGHAAVPGVTEFIIVRKPPEPGKQD
jgi:uncharacterized protein (TIGR02246 family)